MVICMLKKLYYLLHKLTSRPKERGSYSSGYLQEKVRDEALAMCGKLAGRLLDVGCGEGLLIAPLASKDPYISIWGVDNNEKRLKEAEKKVRDMRLTNVEMRFADATELPFSDGYFDMVTCVNTIFNMDSIETVKKVFGEMTRVLKAGGKLVFDFRNSANLVLVLKYKFAPFYDDTVKTLPLRTFSRKEINGILKGLGLKIVDEKYVPASFSASRWGRTFAPIIVVEAQKA